MKITKISIRQLSYAAQRPYANSSVWNRFRNVWVVEVETDAGICGWGEGTAPLSSALLTEHVLGQDPFAVAALCRAATMAGCSYAAWSAVDIALYDIMGKATERPVRQLDWQRTQEHMPPMASPQ